MSDKIGCVHVARVTRVQEAIDQHFGILTYERRPRPTVRLSQGLS
jgi:hypothetical protein